MSRSLWTIGELVWRQINSKGSDEAKNTIEEYVETAKDIYANLVFRTYLELRQENEELFEPLLSRKPYPVKTDEQGYYTELETDVMDLPKDLGVYMVQEPGCDIPMVKTSAVSRNLFHNMPGVRTYYRLGSQLRYPDGFYKHDVKKVFVTLVSLTDVDGSLEVPDIFADPISDKLFLKYGKSAGIPADDSNNKNANR